MAKERVIIKLPKDSVIPPKKMITLLKWFQKWVSPNIKRISLEREVNTDQLFQDMINRCKPEVEYGTHIDLKSKRH